MNLQSIIFPKEQGFSVPDQTKPEFEKFRDFARQIMSVPRSAIQPQLDAEREKKRTSKSSSSRVPDVSSKKS
jgi:hypothetical protein